MAASVVEFAQTATFTGAAAVMVPAVQVEYPVAHRLTHFHLAFVLICTLVRPARNGVTQLAWTWMFDPLVLKLRYALVANVEVRATLEQQFCVTTRVSLILSVHALALHLQIVLLNVTVRVLVLMYPSLTLM